MSIKKQIATVGDLVEALKSTDQKKAINLFLDDETYYVDLVDDSIVGRVDINLVKPVEKKDYELIIRWLEPPEKKRVRVGGDVESALDDDGIFYYFDNLTELSNFDGNHDFVVVGFSEVEK